MNTVNVKECLNLNLKLLFFSSVFPNDVSSKAYLNCLYKSFNIFTIFLLCFTGMGIPLWLFYTEYPLEEGIEVMSILITQLRCLSRFLTFVIHRNRIRKLISNLYNNFNVHKENFDDEESHIIEGTITKCRKITKYYVGLFCCTGISMVLQPLTAKEAESFEKYSNSTSGSHRSLPFKTYFPKWDSTRSPQYEAEYISHSYLAMIESYGIGTIDTFCVSVLMYLSCQFELLSVSLRNVKRNVLMNVNNKKFTHSFIVTKNSFEVPKEDIITPRYRNVITDKTQVPVAITCDSALVETEFVNYITKCIQHHQALLRYVDCFNASFSNMFFFILLTSSILICMMGFQVIVMPLKGLMFVRVVLHLSCTIFELGFFCWFGSDVMHKSVTVHNAAYESEWQDMSRTAKNSICLIIMRAQRPVPIRAGIFGGLCLPTFGTMMKNAYSYLALLKQVHEGDVEE